MIPPGNNHSNIGDSKTLRSNTENRKMRKIGILTLPLHSNYGGLLQAYALQRTLESMGHKVLLIDGKVAQSTWTRKILSLFKQIILKIIKGSPVIQPDWTTDKEKKIIGQYTGKFVQEYIKTTDKLNSVINYKSIEKYEFDTYIVGSDQVWRPQYTPSITNYFYDFLASTDNVRRIAYAASFGVDKWIFNPGQTKKCRALAKRFDAVGVREDSGIMLCEQKLGIDAIKTLDPTLLLPRTEYEKLVSEEQIKKYHGKLFVYVLDKSETNVEIINKATNILGMSSFTIMPRKDMKNLTKTNIDDYIFPPVAEWIGGFMGADFIITDSFHGTLFSIIFNKPFVSIGNKKRGLSRFTSILNQLGLEERLVLKLNHLTNELIKTPINYNQVNKQLESYKEESLQFLGNAVETSENIQA